MEKIYGAIERCDGIQRVGLQAYEVYYGFGEDEQGTYVYCERMNVKPTFAFIKDMILTQINANTQEKITSGFKWNALLVWLSEANQLNYARDFAVAYYCEKNGEAYTLPTYKFGTDEEPVYYTFETFEEFMLFSKAWAQHVSDTVRAGWDEKANVDWERYKV